MAGTEYVIAKLMPNGFRIIETYHTDLDNYRYSNWLLIHKDMVEALSGAL